jgi:S-adenosylmethionine/arginine decarboxylase-like enzyme
MSKEHWGYHLIADMAGCNESVNNPQTVSVFLRLLVGNLQMFPIGAPIVVYVDTPEGKGVSGVQMITTSTITFHGDADGNCVYLDVFSCKEYDPKVVFELVKDFFKPQAITHKWLYRDAPQNTVEPQQASVPS